MLQCRQRCRSPTFAPASKQLLHLKPATLDFMPVDVDRVDCFVAAAAASLGTVIGSLLSVSALPTEEKKKPEAPAAVPAASSVTVADVAFNLSSIIATTAGVALARSCRTSTFWYPGSVLLPEPSERVLNMSRGSPVTAVQTLATGCFALISMYSVSVALNAALFPVPCVFIAPLASFTACAASFMQKQMKWPAVNDNPRLGGLFIAISVGTACAPSYVRLMSNGIWPKRRRYENEKGLGAISPTSAISCITAAAAIARICGAPVSVVFAAAASSFFIFPLLCIGGVALLCYIKWMEFRFALSYPIK